MQPVHYCYSPFPSSFASTFQFSGKIFQEKMTFQVGALIQSVKWGVKDVCLITSGHENKLTHFRNPAGHLIDGNKIQKTFTNFGLKKSASNIW